MRRILTVVCTALWLCCFARSAPADPTPSTMPTVPGLFDVRAFGAVGDGTTLDTPALQRAIDACAAAGGGRVRLAAGTFLSGTLVLKSHVTLEIEAGATLLGSTSLRDYPPHVPALRSFTDSYTDKSLIYAEKQQHIALVGRGTIRGQGGNKAFEKKPYKSRPYLLRIVECDNVTVRDLTLRDSPMWVQHYLGCENVLLDGLTVHSLVNHNNDGIDIDSCDKVRIANCTIASGDDGICLKATTTRPCRRVVVTNCTVRSDCNAFKCGTESNGGFQDIAVSNCVFYDTRLSGIALETVDGGTMERVVLSGITLQDARGGIFLRLGNRARPVGPDQPKPGLGRMRDIILRDIQAAGAGPVGCSLTGLPERAVENVTLENVRVRCDGAGPADAAGKEVPELADKYPEFKMFGPLPAYGFYLRHAKNIRMVRCDLGWEKPDPRPALVCDDVKNLRLQDLQARAAKATLVLNNVSDAAVESCRAAEDAAGPFLRVQGAASARIRLWNNDLRPLKEPVRLDPDAPKDAVEELAPRKPD